MSRAQVYMRGRETGELERLNDGTYCYAYASAYLASADACPISLTLPLRPEPYLAAELFPFLHGLLSEGSAKDLQCRALKIDPADAFTRLIKTSHSDTIGAVTEREIIEAKEVQEDA